MFQKWGGQWTCTLMQQIIVLMIIDFEVKDHISR